MGKGQTLGAVASHLCSQTIPWLSHFFSMCSRSWPGGGEGRSLVGHFPRELPGKGWMVPGVIDPAVNSHWQEGVEVEPDGEIILCFAIAHPVHHIRLVQLCFQLVPKTPGHWRHHRGRAEPVTNPKPPTLWGCPLWCLSHPTSSAPLGLPGWGWLGTCWSSIPGEQPALHRREGAWS